MGSVIGHSDSGCRCVSVKEIEGDRMKSYGMNVLLSVLGPRLEVCDGGHLLYAG